MRRLTCINAASDGGIEKITHWGAEWSVLLTQYRAGNKIEKIEMGEACSTMGKGEVCTGFWWRNMRERDRWGDPRVDGRIILGWIFKKWNVGVRTGLGWLRIGTRGGRLCVR
jgi:hypothetical protein